MKWPEEVTMVTARDICRDMYNRNGLHCSLGWCGADFGVDIGGLSTNEHPELIRWARTFAREARRLGAKGLNEGDEPGNIVVDVNDDLKNTKSLIARIINRTWGALGYVVGNPECDRNGNLKPV